MLNQADVNKSAIRTYTGRVLEHGVANFNFDLQEKPNYFAKLATDKGEKIILGGDLERAMSEREIKTGDDITLAFLGSNAVTVEALKRNEEGKVIGTEKITTNRQNFSTYVFQPGDAEETDANLKLTKLYNFNSIYCPTKAGQSNMTLAKCMYPKEKNIPPLDEFETGKNPNCIKYDGRCFTESELLPPM